jgi:hypothetical protein
MSPPPSDPVLSVRTAVVLVLSVVTGLVAGALGYLSQHDVAAAVLIGGGALGCSVMLFDHLLGRGRDQAK